MQGAASHDEPGDDLHRGRLPRAEQRRALGPALDVLERPLHSGCQPQPGRCPADRRGRRQAVWPRRSTPPRRSSPISRPPCNRRSAPARQIRGPWPRPTRCSRQVAQLNQGIVAGDSAGQNVNALGDERRSAVDQLAGFLGISTSTAPDGALTIYSGGVQLVSGNVAQTLMSTGSAATGNLGVATSSGIALQPSGSIGADLTAVNTTLPGYQAQLSAVANALAGEPQHAPGQRHGCERRSRCGHRRGLHRDRSAEHLRRPGFGLLVHAQRHVGRHHRRLVRLSGQTLRSSPPPPLPGPSNSNVIGSATLDSTNAQAMAAVAGSATGPTRCTSRSSAPSAQRRRTHRAPRLPHRTWPPRPRATWHRSPE